MALAYKARSQSTATVTEGLFQGPIYRLVKRNFKVKIFYLLFQVRERFNIFFPQPLTLYTWFLAV